MKLRMLTLAAALLPAMAGSPLIAQAQSSPSPKPKISVAPKTIHDAKNKQDTMIKRSERHTEATSGNTASGENPQNVNPRTTPTPKPH